MSPVHYVDSDLKVQGCLSSVQSKMAKVFMLDSEGIMYPIDFIGIAINSGLLKICL